MCDFNLSRMVANDSQLTNSGNPNSPGWQSPEMLSGQPYSKEADVFSFGVVLWEVVTLKEPWRDETEGRTALYYIMNCVTTGTRLSFPKAQELDPDVPELADVIQLAQSCWAQNPRDRPTMEQVAASLKSIIDRLRDRRRSSLGGGASGGGVSSGRSESLRTDSFKADRTNSTLSAAAAE